MIETNNQDIITSASLILMCDKFSPTSPVQENLFSHSKVELDSGTYLPAWYPKTITLLDVAVQWIVFILLILEWLAFIALCINYILKRSKLKDNDPNKKGEMSEFENGPKYTSVSPQSGTKDVHEQESAIFPVIVADNKVDSTIDSIQKPDSNVQNSPNQQNVTLKLDNIWNWLGYMILATFWILHLLHDYVPYIYDKSDSLSWMKSFPGIFLHVCPTSIYQYMTFYIWFGKFSSFLWVCIHYSRVTRLSWMMIYLKNAWDNSFFLIFLMIPAFAISITSQTYSADGNFVPVDSSWWSSSSTNAKSIPASQYCYLISRESMPTFNVLSTRVGWIALASIYLVLMLALFIRLIFLVRKQPMILFRECSLAFLFGAIGNLCILIELLLEIIINGTNSSFCFITYPIVRNSLLLAVFFLTSLHWVQQAMPFIYFFLKPLSDQKDHDAPGDSTSLRNTTTNMAKMFPDHPGWLSHQDEDAPKYHYSLRQAPVYDPEVVLPYIVPSLASSAASNSIEDEDIESKRAIEDLPIDCMALEEEGVINPLKPLPLFVSKVDPSSSDQNMPP